MKRYNSRRYRMGSTVNGPLNDYNDMLQLLKSDDMSRKDVYSELMEKEENVLNTISRISSQERIKTIYENTFGQLTIRDVFARFAFTWQNIFNELIVERMFSQALDVLFMGDRKIYVGIMIVIISLFLFIAKL